MLAVAPQGADVVVIDTFKRGSRAPGQISSVFAAERAADWGTSGTRLVHRGRLLEALDRAVARKVTVISAPAGSGKTSLLRAWALRSAPEASAENVRADTRPRSSLSAQPVAFVGVRRDQHDEQLFWLSLLDAIRQAVENSRSDDALSATPGFNADAIVDRVLSELVDYAGRLVLVIDDVHELTSDGALAHLSRLLTELPPNVHAVLGTRRDPQLGLHQLRLAGELAELRAADLRFTEAETRELLVSCGVVLTETAVATLHQRTEGWAAGLRLAAIALADHADPERFVAEFSGSHRTIADYLLAEMLDVQPEPVRKLLLRTCLLDRVNGELADLMTGYRGSEQMLLDLEDANAFVASINPERTWFRYHQLFGDLLRLELRRTEPAEVAQLHQLAATWLADHGQPLEAIRHLQAAGDWSNAARLLADHSFGLRLDGRAETIQALVRVFPDPRGAAAEDADLALVYATQDIVQGRLDQAAARVQLAEQHAKTTSPDRQHRVNVAIASMKLELAMRRGDFDGVIQQCKLLSSPPSARSNADVVLASDLRAFALLTNGIVEAWTLQLAEAERDLLEGAELARKIGRPYLEVSCLCRLALVSKLHSFADARSRCEDAIGLAEQHGWGNDTVIAPALATLGETLAWTAQFDAAEAWLERAAKASQDDAEPGTRLLIHLVGGMLRLGRGELRRALEQFSAAARTQSVMIGEHALSALVTGWMISTHARLGMLDEARAALRAVPAERALVGEVRNAAAVIHLAESEPTAALLALEDVFNGLSPVLHDFTLVESHLLAARAHNNLGEHRAANSAVERALAMAEPDRLILPFLLTGSGDLLQGVPRHETAHAALLIDILDVLCGSGVHSRARPPTPPLQELTHTELRVLRFLPTNLSRPEIARELYLSVNTVNTHVRNIYMKLEARDRSTALKRARDLRLISCQ